MSDPTRSSSETPSIVRTPNTSRPRSRPPMEWGAVSNAGLVRSSNQDCCFVGRFDRTLQPLLGNLPADAAPGWHHDAGHVALVADGMGGEAAGELASLTTITTLLELALETPDWIMRYDEPLLVAEVTRRIGERVRAVDGMLASMGRANPRLAGMGTTLTILVLLPPHGLVTNVGDSRAYLCRGTELSRLTTDHTMAQELADAGLIDERDLPRHPKRNLLTRAVGHGDGQLPMEVTRITVQPGDRFLLCTDGLTDELTDGEIHTVLTTTPSAALAAQALVDLALQRGGRDNVTAVVGHIADAADQ